MNRFTVSVTSLILDKPVDRIIGLFFVATCFNKIWFARSEDDILKAGTPRSSRKSTLCSSYGVDKNIIPVFLHLS